MFDTQMIFLEVIFENVDSEKKKQSTKNMQNYPACKELKLYLCEWVFTQLC